MKLKINDRISWLSAAGHLEGTVVNIVLSENGHYETVPWIDVKTNRTTSLIVVPGTTIIRLCATHSNLICMRVQKEDALVEA